MYTQSVALTTSAVDLARTIHIDHLGVGATDFEIDNAAKNQLIQSGWDSTLTHLQACGMDTNAWGTPTLLDESQQKTSKVLS